MYSNGEKNARFGVYVSQCCGREIIIREGATFPDCPNHTHLPTIWKLSELEADVIVLKPKDKSADSAA